MKKRLGYFVAILGVAVLASSHTITALANEVIPISSASWREDYPGMLLIDDPNPQGAEITYFARFYRDGELLVSSYNVGSPYRYGTINDLIYETGNYYADIYMFPGRVEYTDVYKRLNTCKNVFTSEVYTYIHPGVSLPRVGNIVLYSDGVFTWDAIESDFLQSYYVRLYEVNNKKKSVNEKYKFVMDDYVYADESYSAGKCSWDISNVFDPNKKYALSVISVSKDIEVVAHQQALDEFEDNIMEIKMTDAKERTADSIRSLMPVSNLQWNGPYVTFDNLNTEDTVFKFVLKKDEQVVMTFDNYYENKKQVSYAIDCTDGLAETGKYVAEVYVMPADCSYTTFERRYSEAGKRAGTLALHYTNPGKISVPIDLKFGENGVVTWSGDGRASKYIAVLYDITSGKEEYVTEQWVVENGVNATRMDFSNYMDANKKYAIKFSVWSKNAFVYGHSTWSDAIKNK